MFSDAELLPISALQHLLYCPRQCALIHLERLWAENRFTVEGRHLHERADSGRSTSSRQAASTGSRQAGSTGSRQLRTERAVPLWSYGLGLFGKADVVELRAAGEAAGGRGDAETPGRGGSETRPATGAVEWGWGDKQSGGQGDAAAEERTRAQTIEGETAAGSRQVSTTGDRKSQTGDLTPFPVEYKRGKPKGHDADRVQLCAQAMCLEEMLGVAVPGGALFYGRTRRRQDVAFDAPLRELTVKTAARLHELIAAGRTPAAVYEKRKCDRCSLKDLCLPRAPAARAAAYLARSLAHSLAAAGPAGD